ncbi:MAG: hypothetical protein ABFD97_23185 [Syntrophobacter sp.]
MLPSDLIAQLIDLQEKANVHITEFRRLEHLPGNKSKASVHRRKAVKLRSRIQEIIHEIAASRVQ